MPEEWFLVWAPDKDDAIAMVDGNVAEPDVRSMREIVPLSYLITVG
jgi:hypothetical protein